ncbi:MAG: hypothetical protein R6U96_15685 [Promethearchaeia archaeon]
MDLGTLEIVSGTFSIIFVLISSYVGVRIAKRYFDTNQKEFLFVGIAWIGIVSPWWPSSVSFLSALITGKGISDGLYFIIGNAFIIFFMNCWLAAFTELIYKKLQKVIMIGFSIWNVIFEIFLFYYIFTGQTSMIGTLNGVLDVRYEGLTMIFLITIIVILFSTGIFFGRESLKSEHKEIKLKGKLLIWAIFLWSVGAALDSVIPLNLITLPITRIILITSSILFLGGWILPDWMKKIFLDNK